MNNNYHTQLDKKNILHTIALNDQLIQNSQNTDYRNSNAPNDNTNYKQNNDYIGYNNNNDEPNYSQNKQPIEYVNYNTGNTNYKQNDYIDYSTNNDNTNNKQILQNHDSLNFKQKPFDTPNINTQANNKTIDPSKVQNIEHTNTTKLTDNEIELTDGNLIHSVKQDQGCKKINGVVTCSLPKQQKQLTNNAKLNYNNYIYEFAVLPLVIIVVFTLLTYPTSSLLLEKYLPKMDSLRGVVIRGILLGVIFIIAKLILKTITSLQKIEK